MTMTAVTMTEPREETAHDRAASASTANVTAADAERRLHPMSWLFVLLQQLKNFVLPLIAAFFFGGDRNELWPLIGVGVLAVVSVWRMISMAPGLAPAQLVYWQDALRKTTETPEWKRDLELNYQSDEFMAGRELA